ncbi:hypothetical protein [Priestia megaterium]|uniref:hypothetical protein n=1 Tax=Priestia megaterium TaxID=1404 RepID=UPI002877FAD8|nr:hypothetical protein [Priestia megaterium]
MPYIADVFEALVFDKNGEVICQDTLQQANIQVEVEENEVRGGQGNDLLLTLHGAKNVTITLNNPVWNFELLAMRLGSDVVTGASVAYATHSYKTAATGVAANTTEITLDKEPIEGTLKMEMSDGTPIAGYTVNGKTVVISDVVVQDGDEIKVLTYQYNTPASTKTTVIDSKKFPPDVKIVLQTLKIDDQEQPEAFLQFQFDRAKPASNFTMNTQSQREAAVDEQTFKVMKPKGSDQLGTLKEIPIDAMP